MKQVGIDSSEKQNNIIVDSLEYKVMKHLSQTGKYLASLNFTEIDT